MSIVTESNIPNLILQLNAIQKQVNYRGINRDISDSYWNDEILPRLYPIWDSDKDKLVQFNFYDTGAFLVRRRKFVKNFSTNQYEWKEYEMEVRENSPEVEEAKEIFTSLKEAFYLIDSIEKENYQNEFTEAYAKTKTISWLGIRLCRNFLLQDSDWVFVEDSVVSDEEKELWKKYRKELRDLSQIDEYREPDEVKFPISPYDWKVFYKPEHPDEEYLGSEQQYLKLAAHFVNQYKDRIVQHLLVRQQVMSPLNYKNYQEGLQKVYPPDPINSPLTLEETQKMMAYLSDDIPSTAEEKEEQIVDALLSTLTDTGEE
jgi:hypothetical protein